ncbi:MAG: winged helix-turn-helix domain-containing protein [bacterium]|nr:winged helix-turn-helix domain-containing protein [bacterium]
MLETFFISKVRVKVLTLFFSCPGEMFHVREIVRRTQEEINAVRRELARLEKEGLLKSEWRANRRYYNVQTGYIFFPELVRLVAKSNGIGAKILANRMKLGKVKYAILSLGYVLGKDVEPDDVNIFIVGDIVLPELGLLIREEENRKGSAVNYTPMSEDEFVFRKRRRDPFIMRLLASPRVMVIGDETALMDGSG